MLTRRVRLLLSVLAPVAALMMFVFGAADFTNLLNNLGINDTAPVEISVTNGIVPSDLDDNVEVIALPFGGLSDGGALATANEFMDGESIGKLHLEDPLQLWAVNYLEDGGHYDIIRSEIITGGIISGGSTDGGSLIVWSNPLIVTV